VSSAVASLSHVHLPARRFATLLVIALMAAVALVAVPSKAFAGPNEYDFFAAANSARANAGVPAYTYAGDLAAAARAQAARMASSGELYHNPNLGGSVSNWQGLAENVGVGPDWQTIHQAFMNSSSHRAAILDAGYTQMGVGTVIDKDGTMWVAEVFRLPAGASAPAPQADAGSSAGATTGSTATASSPSSSVAAAPTPTQILRGKIANAREKVARKDKVRGPTDPLEAALDFNTVMETVGS
jgi:hypothetical protein